jgi:hypothetical protein
LSYRSCFVLVIVSVKIKVQDTKKSFSIYSACLQTYFVCWETSSAFLETIF